MRRRTHFLLIGAGAIVGLLAAAGSRAQEGSGLRIYQGDPARQSGIKLMSWGSGEVAESEDYAIMGSKSIKITTHGLYQGARLVFEKPLNLKPFENDPSAYIVLAVRLPDKSSTGRMAGGVGGIGAPEAAMRGGFGIGGPGGRGGGIGGLGGRGGRLGGTGGAGTGGGDNAARMTKPKSMENLRIVAVTTDDKRLETLLPIGNATKSRDEWSTLALPIAALSRLKETSGQIKEALLFGDSYAVFYLGEARVVRDETPIRVDPLAERTVAVNDTVTFTSSAGAGVTPLKYEWDFDAANGVGVDAEGRTIQHTFRKSRPDDYVVTLTVRDVYGLKKPVTVKTKVHVTL